MALRSWERTWQRAANDRRDLQLRKKHLGTSDTGIITVRRRLLNAIKKYEADGDEVLNAAALFLDLARKHRRTPQGERGV